MLVVAAMVLPSGCNCVPCALPRVPLSFSVNRSVNSVAHAITRGVRNYGVGGWYVAGIFSSVCDAGFSSAARDSRPVRVVRACMSCPAIRTVEALKETGWCGRTEAARLTPT